MNTPTSREGNLIRYTVYLLAMLMVLGINQLVVKTIPLKTWDVVLYLLVAAAVLLFFVYRFNREARFFEKDTNLNWLDYCGLTIALTVVVAVIRISVSYLQASGRLPLFGFQQNYLRHEAVNLFWFLILSQGIVIPILQGFLASGFLFNYLFRGNSALTGVVGILASALIFAGLNFQFTASLFLINAFYGALFAWSYLVSQSIWMPTFLAVANGLLMIVMM